MVTRTTYFNSSVSHSHLSALLTPLVAIENGTSRLGMLGISWKLPSSPVSVICMCVQAEAALLVTHGEKHHLTSLTRDLLMDQPFKMDSLAID